MYIVNFEEVSVAWEIAILITPNLLMCMSNGRTTRDRLCTNVWLCLNTLHYSTTIAIEHWETPNKESIDTRCVCSVDFCLEQQDSNLTRKPVNSMKQ